MKLVSKEILFESPDEVSLIYGNSFYICSEGLKKIQVRSVETKDDLLDSMEVCISDNNGLTWNSPQLRKVMFKEDKGTRRLYEFPGFVDPDTGKLLTLTLEANLPDDIASQGLSRFILKYRVSSDGGKTVDYEGQMIQKGNFDSDHPFEQIWIGNNSIMLGDMGGRPIKTSSGKILIPAQMTLSGDNGSFYIPKRSRDYFAAVVLIAKWTESRMLEFDISNPIILEPEKSTRGSIEPTIIELENGRILMVVRGSNDGNLALPGYKWFCFSQDGGYTWSQLKPWTYEDETKFFSPSSCSQLLKHSNGNVYWLGNITPINPNGNWPRYPFIIGQVNSQTGLLIHNSILKIDDCQSDEAEQMTLSNFMGHEDRQTHEIILHMSRWQARGNMSGDAYIYRIEV